MVGASMLSAEAALRTGVGSVKILCSKKIIAKIRLPSFGKKPDAAILDIVHALGFTIWNKAAS